MTRDATSFTYTSEPHSAPRLFSQTVPNRGGGSGSGAIPLSMMSDPRVVRGSTHALARKVAKSRADEISEKVTMRHIITSAVEDSTGSSSMAHYSFVTKPFVEKDVDIMQYLVEPEDVIVPTKEVDTQADDFSPLLPPATYIPRKTGIDKFTEIEDQTELFVFDREVEPMLEVIVRKTMEQAVVEVEHEFELLRLQDEVSHYEEQMRNETNWMLEQENNIRQKHEDIRFRLNGVLATKATEKRLKLGIAGAQMVHQLLPSMFDDINRQFLESGHWYKPDNECVKHDIVPMLYSQSATTVNALVLSRSVLDGTCDYSDDLIHLIYSPEQISYWLRWRSLIASREFPSPNQR
jgi:radial spoke head protein 3